MTVDPNNPEQGELPINEVPAAPEAPAVEAPPALDVDAVAQRAADIMLEKLMAGAQTNAPESQTQAYQPMPGGNVIQTLQEQARDPNHPLYATATAQIEMLRRQGEEEEWAMLGIPPGHPSRMLYMQNPQAFSGRPRHAVTTWQLQEAQRGNNDRAREAAAEAVKVEAAKAAREAVPGMPSRSVAPPTAGAGKDVYDTMDDYNRAAALDPKLDDRYDRGEITIRNH